VAEAVNRGQGGGVNLGPGESVDRRSGRVVGKTGVGSFVTQGGSARCKPKLTWKDG